MNEDAHLEAQYEERYENDGPAGDFLGDYWFNHDGPDEVRDGEPSGHEHECRDCGEGFDCYGRDDYRGCELFNGSCRDCESRDIPWHLTEESDPR